MLGPGPIAVASAVLATWSFSRLTRRFFVHARVASVLFGVGTVTNIAVGRLTFGLGMAIGATALLAMVNSRRVAAIGLALLTPLASPVAGVFLALAAGAWWLAGQPRRRSGLCVAAAALLPIGVLAVAFPEGGTFPFSGEDVLFTITVGAAALVLPKRHRALRIGGVLYSACAVGLFLVPNPIGANFTRLAIYAAPPIAIGVLWPARRVLAVAIALPVLVWQWSAALDPIFTAGRDPSSDAVYYSGLLSELSTLGPTRVEIPFTKHHWEANFVAPHAALARGWERQLDIDVNPLFYSDAPLTTDAYMHWLHDSAVGYVALPDVELDDSAIAEAQLIRRGVPDLHPIWHDVHWTLFEVVDATPLVTGPGTLDKIDANSFTVRVSTPGEVVVRIRYSSYWDVQGPGCTTATADGWTAIWFSTPGSWRIRQVVSGWIPFQSDRGDQCPP